MVGMEVEVTVVTVVVAKMVVAETDLVWG